MLDRLLGLPLKYWRPKVLFAIAGAIGVPISMDEATINKVFSHYTRILVDIDLAKEQHDQILVEREGFAFFVVNEYERLPDFCPSCKVIGH